VDDLELLLLLVVPEKLLSWFESSVWLELVLGEVGLLWASRASASKAILALSYVLFLFDEPSCLGSFFSFCSLQISYTLEENGVSMPCGEHTSSISSSLRLQVPSW